jgi:hypothetical protein
VFGQVLAKPESGIFGDLSAVFEEQAKTAATIEQEGDRITGVWVE